MSVRHKSLLNDQQERVSLVTNTLMVGACVAVHGKEFTARWLGYDFKSSSNRDSSGHEHAALVVST